MQQVDLAEIGALYCEKRLDRRRTIQQRRRAAFASLSVHRTTP